MNQQDNTSISIPDHLKIEYQSYLEVCKSLGVEPSKKRFLRYNELYPLEDDQ